MRDKPQRWARLGPQHYGAYPVTYQGQWFRVVEGHDPDVPLAPGHIRLEAPGGVQAVPAERFEIVERQKRLILVVDDDAGIRKTLKIALDRGGYEVIQARDGEEANHLWQARGPDLIIADIHMPQKSGLLLMEDLQARGSPTPIIAMTDGGAAGNPSLLGLARLLGAVRTIVKPFTLEEMVQAVNQELDR